MYFNKAKVLEAAADQFYNSWKHGVDDHTTRSAAGTQVVAKVQDAKRKAQADRVSGNNEKALVALAKKAFQADNKFAGRGARGSGARGCW